MPRAIADTGPILHLHEIGRLDSLGVFDRLEMADLVAAELGGFKLTPSSIEEAAELEIILATVDEASWKSFIDEKALPRIQSADAQVAALAKGANYEIPVLTDDLDLRKVIESKGGTAVGSVGILVRAYGQE